MVLLPLFVTLLRLVESVTVAAFMVARPLAGAIMIWIPCLHAWPTKAPKGLSTHSNNPACIKIHLLVVIMTA